MYAGFAFVSLSVFSWVTTSIVSQVPAWKQIWLISRTGWKTSKYQNQKCTKMKLGDQTAY